MDKYINQIICGNCLEVMKEWPDGCVDLCLTDPPYGLSMDRLAYKKSGKQYGRAAAANAYYPDTNWDMVIPDKTVFKELSRISKNQIIWGGQYYTSFLSVCRGWLIWDKRCSDNISNCYGDGEMAWTTFDKPLRIFRYLWNGMLQENMANKEKRYHPTQKPLQLMKWCIYNYSNPNDLIVDFYSGSGTTCVAAKMLGRRYIGIDISEEYCQISRDRLEAVETGLTVEEQKQGQMPLFK